MYGLPMKKIQFHTEHNHDLVLSMDAQVGFVLAVLLNSLIFLETPGFLQKIHFLAPVLI
jgi:hypothetical protein